ncbi:MAG TPA: hypothetical protein VGN37_10540 [Actinocatenispora sp.]
MGAQPLRGAQDESPCALAGLRFLHQRVEDSEVDLGFVAAKPVLGAEGLDENEVAEGEEAVQRNGPELLAERDDAQLDVAEAADCE